MGKDFNLTIDYTWRKRGNINNVKFTRMKLISNTQNVFEVHLHDSPANVNGTEMRRVPANELSLNHYKRPHQGVFVGGWVGGGHNMVKKNVLGPGKVVEDSRLRDDFRGLLVERLARSGSQ